MRQVNMTICIDQTTLQEIKSMYGKNNYPVVSAVVNDIFNRYMSTEYFDPELVNLEFPNECDDGYTVCGRCKEKAITQKVFDGDGKNLIKCKVCENCGSGRPKLD